jgi:succinate dehydrogenase hydrophobic anchor subunit
MTRTRFHLLFLFSGVATAVVLGIHMAIQHFNNLISGSNQDPTSWTSMISRATDKSWVVVFVLLLAFALYHALYGLRGIILELSTSDTTIRAINWGFIIGGIIVFGWGNYALFVLFFR